MIYYAKSDTKESIAEHTLQLLERLYYFKQLYDSSLDLTARDWELLEIAVKYHDVGKADLVFQKIIRQTIGLEFIKPISAYDIPHNFISVLAIPYYKMDLTCEEQDLVSQVVAYHHERQLTVDKKIDSNYEKNILPYLKQIEEQLTFKVNDSDKFPTLTNMGYLLEIEFDEEVDPSKLNAANHQNRITQGDPNYYRYVLLKGLLHRFDHAASAGVPIELAADMNVSEYAERYITGRLGSTLNELQQFTKHHHNHHLVVVAQTGMGKTEAGLLWLGSDKGFFTLPLRVSINAMYDRVIDECGIGFSKISEQYGQEATGLLHSTSMDHLYEQVEGNDELLERIHSQSKQYANKLIISTIDQVLKFPFYYLGFEKEYATMATAKIIIDELQAYDPKIAALIIRAMKLIDDIGGSFMIMTATLPDFYYKALKRELAQPNKPLSYETFIDDKVERHRVELLNQAIIAYETIEQIVQSGQKKKVLVICNTVDRACEVYEAAANYAEELKSASNISLLHARFIQKDRQRLEQALIKFEKAKDTPGIWVTTQIVEASLDIDFDVLFTEMSSLDSQFQRYGRVNRKGSKPTDKTNIYVLTSEVSGVSKGSRSVYHHEIYNYSLHLLSNYSNKLLLETEKQCMITELYDEDRLENSSFKAEFDDTLKQLKNRPHYEIKSKEAQELLRDIQQIQVIPIQFISDPGFMEALELWQKAGNKIERRRRRAAIELYSVGANEYVARKNSVKQIDGMNWLYYIHCNYSGELGLRLNELSQFD